MIVETLRRARAVLSEESRWTQHVCVRDAAGHSIRDVGSVFAVQWSIVGAMERAARELAGEEGWVQAAADALWALIDGIFGLQPQYTMSVSAWEDAPARTHAEVLDAFDLAIALQERFPEEEK